MTVLDVKALNEKFYQELADWYYWALRKETGVCFPKGQPLDDSHDPATTGRPSVAMIRLPEPEPDGGHVPHHQTERRPVPPQRLRRWGAGTRVSCKGFLLGHPAVAWLPGQGFCARCGYLARGGAFAMMEVPVVPDDFP